MDGNRILISYLNRKRACGACTLNGTVIESVMTLAEVKKRYPVQDSTLRLWLTSEDVFLPGEARKSGGTWIILQSAIERVLESKNMFKKKFLLNGKEINASILLTKEEIDSKKQFCLWSESIIDEKIRFRISDYIEYPVKPVIDIILFEEFGTEHDIEDVVITLTPDVFVLDKKLLYISSQLLFEKIFKSNKVSDAEKKSLKILLTEFYAVKKMIEDGTL